MSRFVRCAASALGLVLLVGCGQATPPANIEGGDAVSAVAEPPPTFPDVIAEEVEYYTAGPQQGRPPDGKLAAGTKVNVRRSTGGYSLVRTADGIEGYISTDAIADPAGQSAR
ncbi:MAG: hypothetical protein AB7O59_01995 [Pirellulales bacterium]